MKRRLAELRRQLASEIAEPQCPVCVDLRDELINARLVALEMMDRLKDEVAKRKSTP